MLEASQNRISIGSRARPTSHLRDLSCHGVSCHIISNRVMPSHIVPCWVMSCRLMCVVSCHVEGCLRHFVSCHVAFCRVLSCHVVVPKRRVCGSFFCSRICQSHSTTHEAASCCLSKKILCTSWAGPTSKTQWKVRLCGQSPSATTSRQKRHHKKNLPTCRSLTIWRIQPDT